MARRFSLAVVASLAFAGAARGAGSQSGLPMELPKGFKPWQAPEPDVYVSIGDGVLLEVRPLAVRVHPDVDPAVAAVEMADITGYLPRSSARPGGGLRFEWGDDNAGATGALLPNGETAFLATCRWDVPSKTRPKAKAAARAACLETLDAARATAPPPEAALPVTPPNGFRRGLGPSPEALWYGVDPDNASLLVVETGEPLPPDPSPEDMSHLTDRLVGGGMQVNSLDSVPIGAVDAVRFAGKASHPAGTVAVMGWLLPQGRKTLMLLAVTPEATRDKYAPRIEEVARSAQNLAPPPGAKKKTQEAAGAAPAKSDSTAKPAAHLSESAKAALVVGGLAVLAVVVAVLLVMRQGRERDRQRRAAVERARRFPGTQ